MRLLTLLVAIITPLTAALKFDLHPVAEHDSAKYELVVVTAILDGYRGDGQKVDMHVRPRKAAPQTQCLEGMQHNQHYANAFIDSGRNGQ